MKRLRYGKFLTLTFFSLLLFAGCGRKEKKNLIPESNLPAEEQEEIRDFISNNEHMKNAARYKFAEKTGSEGIPFMIERIMEIYNMGSDWNYPEEYAIASNLILSLGEMDDASVLPALKLWLTDKKYRVFRPDAVHALGALGNPGAMEPLRNVWDEEKGYLDNGDDQGPWPFSGQHPSGGYVHGVMSEIGIALFKLGDKKAIGDLIEIARLSEDRWSSGTTKILQALRKITGESGLAKTSRVEFWEEWWKRNKENYR